MVRTDRPPAGPRPLMRALPPVVVYLWRWVRRNTMTARYLEDSALDWMRLGYDALCEDPDRWLDAMASLADARDALGQHHILLGSFGYLDGTGTKTLHRNLRWQASPRRRLLGVAHALVRASSERLAHKAEVHARHGATAPARKPSERSERRRLR